MFTAVIMYNSGSFNNRGHKMLRRIKGNNINEITIKAYHEIMHAGRTQKSRNGDIYCINNAFIELTNPRSRHLYLEGRNSNISAQIAETLWVLAGDDRVSPFLDFFLPRAPDYSDDGVTWRGAYGPRLYMYDQLEDALGVFINEGIETRRSVIQILLPELDSDEALSEKYSLDGTKDRPCNNELVFFCTPNSSGEWELNMNVMQRSGDALWGALNINTFEWTVLQELFAQMLNEAVEETVILGEYNHLVTNLHIYDNTSKQAKDVLSNYCGVVHKPDTLVSKNQLDHYDFTKYIDILDNENHMELIGPKRISDFKVFFSDIVGRISQYIIADIESSCAYTELTELYHDISDIFKKYGVPEDDNLLTTYINTVTSYVSQKKGALRGGVGANAVCSANRDDDFSKCIAYSKFLITK